VVEVVGGPFEMPLLENENLGEVSNGTKVDRYRSFDCQNRCPDPSL